MQAGPVLTLSQPLHRAAMPLSILTGLLPFGVICNGLVFAMSDFYFLKVVIVTQSRLENFFRNVK